MAMQEHDPRRYDQAWTKLNLYLNEIAQGDLGKALDALHAQQLDQGFIRDDLSGLQRYRFEHPRNTDRFFTVQYNPTRARRFAGSGRIAPPPGAVSVHDGCFLCFENIQWQQNGVEIGFDIQLSGRNYIAWMNPYPLLPHHAVIASREHVAQSWHHADGTVAGRSLSILIHDLVDLARQLPGWIGFYNGPGAGASIPHHFHYQFLRRPAGYGAFPLEQAAVRKKVGQSAGYPVAFAHWHGDTESVRRTAERWIEHWVDAHESRIKNLSANVIAIADNDALIDVYFVPRDQARSRSEEMSGLIGGLEVLGELVFSSEDEKTRLDTGIVDYATVERILGSISVDL